MINVLHAVSGNVMSEIDWVAVFKRIEPSRNVPDVLVLPHWEESSG
jgi:hypothetical protein